MVAAHLLAILLLLPSNALSLPASDSINDSSVDNLATEEDGIEPSRFQKFIAKFEQEQDMRELEADMEEDQMLGESAPIVVRQAPDKIVSPEEPLKQVERHTRQSDSENEVVPGGVDFSQATRLPDGRLCVVKEESVETFAKDPILECNHKDVEKCHYTYITFFKPSQEEFCEENFEKKCQITFKQEAMQEMIRKCYRPIEKVCNGQGPDTCQTIYESSCTTKYIDDGQGGFVGDTRCEKRPVEICGAGCVLEEGPEECHDKTVDTLVDVPEESCDLNPQKTCRLVTRLVPSLKPKQECTIVPKEVCQLKFTQPELRAKPLRTEWCLDEEAAGEASEPQAEYGASPQAEYGAGSARRGRVITSSSNNRNSISSSSTRGKSSSGRIIGSGTNSQLVINSNRGATSGNGSRGGKGNRKKNRGNNRANNNNSNRASSSRLVHNNNNVGFVGASPSRAVANGNRIVGVGNQIVNTGSNARPLPLSNSINNINSNINNINGNNNRATPIGSTPFIRSAQVNSVQPTTTFRKFSG